MNTGKIKNHADLWFNTKSPKIFLFYSIFFGKFTIYIILWECLGGGGRKLSLGGSFPCAPPPLDETLSIGWVHSDAKEAWPNLRER